MRTRRALALLAVLLTAPACASPCRDTGSPRARLAFQRDDERCEDQARKLAGNIDLGDYHACMRTRGWCTPPEE